MDYVLCLNKVEAIVQRSSCKLHAHFVGNLIQRNKVGSILVLDCHSEANVLHAHLTQLFQRAVTTLVAILQATDLVVGLFQALDGNTDTDLRELLAQVNNTISEETVGRNDDTVGLLVQLTHDIFQISTDKRFAASDVCEIHLRQLLDSFDADFLFRLGRCFITVAHGSVAAVSDNNRTIQFLFAIVSHF